MTSRELIALMETRMDKCMSTMISKNKDYAGYGATLPSTPYDEPDALSSFYASARILNIHPIKALLGMWSKHLQSILKIADDVEHGRWHSVGDMLMAEKVGDNINYSILFEALVEDLRNKSKNNEETR